MTIIIQLSNSIIKIHIATDTLTSIIAFITAIIELITVIINVM